MTETDQPHSLTWLLDHTLPLNRKERYFTGTVLPGIVCSADMTHLHKLTALMGHPDVEVSGNPADCGLVFFTEYGLAESAYGPATARFDDLPTNRDTPDVVFLTTRPTPKLFALEAKLYDRPSGYDLRAQLDRQSTLLMDLASRLTRWLDVPDVPIAHYALLPPQQASADLGGAYPVLTWQDVHDAYAEVAPAYWLAILAEAIHRYPDLVTRARPNDDNRLTGADIVVGHRTGALPYTAVGRTGGMTGDDFRADVESGTWRTTRYQVATRHPGNRNWFTIEEFMARTAPEGDPLERFSDSLAHAQSVGARVFGPGSVAEQLLAGIDTLKDAPAHELDRVASLYQAAATAAAEARRAAADLHSKVAGA